MNEMARVIGVIDLSEGLAVHAQGGARAHYGPVQALAGRRITPGDARAVARWYVESLGLAEMYVADLDALRGRAPQYALIRELAGFGVPLWLDAAISSVEAAEAALENGVSKVVVGLETLASFDALGHICRAAGDRPVAFSLDLRRGHAVPSPITQQRPQTPEQLAAHAVSEGARTVIVLDLSRVGMRRGLDLNLLTRIRTATAAATGGTASVELIVGGGVRGVSDLVAAAAAGCAGALVATALYDGRIELGDLRGPAALSG